MTGGNRNDVTQLIPLLQPCRPDVVLVDRGYDHGKYRRLVRDLGVKLLSPDAAPSKALHSASNAGS